MSKPNYIASLPSTSTSAHLGTFFSHFYELSDTPAAHEEYARSFTATATLIMGTRSATGYQDILAFRHGLWTGPVKTRMHTVHKIYPFGDGGGGEDVADDGKDRKEEVMLYGTVAYVLKNGRSVEVDWAGRAVLVQEEEEEEEEEEGKGKGKGKGPWRMSFYQVYMDSEPVMEAVRGGAENR